VLLEAVKRGDVRVVELSEKSGLALEPLQAFFVLRERLGKNLDGNVAAKFGVACSLDFTHPAHTHALDDLVLAELGAGGERHQFSVGTSLSSSSNQLSTMTIWVAADPSALFIIKNRWPSGATSYGRPHPKAPDT